ncbi:MAG: YigZ family protein [Bacteroidales bacterium]|nr:YigZ family protein [Bacteroidales bacterium]
MADTYRTIDSPSNGLFKDRGSKFISFAIPATNEQEVKEHLERIKKEFFDARHHCYAYRLGPDKKTFRAFDDGEPGNSAGKPILGQITAKDLTNILVVVVRYFGGTLLGVGGLVQAYKNASADAIANATVIEKEIQDFISITFDYPLQSKINHILKVLNIKISGSVFENNCTIEFYCRKGITEIVVNKLSELQAIQININDSEI